DVLSRILQEQRTIEMYRTDDFEEIMGGNDRVMLSEAEAAYRKRINDYHMRNGVTLIDPATTNIGADVKIAMDVTIEANVKLAGNCVIGEDTIVGQYKEIHNSKIGYNVIFK